MNENQPAVERGTVLTYEVADDESLSEAVIAAVAAVSDTDPDAMTPLAEVVDPDALDALFAEQYDGTPRGNGSAEFAFLGYELVVTGNGHVTVRDSGELDPS